MSKKARVPAASEQTAPSVQAYVLTALLAISVAAAGLFFEWAACVASVVLSAFLTVVFFKKKKLTVKPGLSFISVAVIVLFHLISVTYAVDKGLALIGFLKFLPVLLFLLSVYQCEGFKQAFEKYFPLFVCGLTAVTSLLFFIPGAKDAVGVDGRLHGLTQYPNAYAIIILSAELMLLKSDRLYLKIPGVAVFAVGLFLTGSRAVMVIALLSNLVLLIHRFRKNKKAVVITIVALAAVAGASVALGFTGIAPFDRILRIFDLKDTTLWCRILYFSDAMPYIAKHPFGVGYLGYSFVQTGFQTGIYNVRFIHNDILQTALDVGWVPAILFSVAAVRAIVRKGRAFPDRVIAAVILAHSLFDFDLQFPAVAFILLFYMADGEGKEKTIKSRPLAAGCFAVAAAASAYFSVALALRYFGNPQASDAMYPANTECKIELLLEAETAEELDTVSDEIIAGNAYVPIAYSAKARAAYSRGDFETLIDYKHKVFELAPFSYEEYADYCDMLIVGSGST